MADIQRQFIQFDDAIRLRHFDENATLREKRDAVLDRLRDGLVSLRKEGSKVPRFEWFLQGSYEMGTGVHPAEGDYGDRSPVMHEIRRVDLRADVGLLRRGVIVAVAAVGRYAANFISSRSTSYQGRGSLAKSTPSRAYGLGPRRRPSRLGQRFKASA